MEAAVAAAAAARNTGGRKEGSGVWSLEGWFDKHRIKSIDPPYANKIDGGTNTAFPTWTKEKSVFQPHSRQHAVDRLDDRRALHRFTRRHEPLHSEPRAYVRININININIGSVFAFGSLRCRFSYAALTRHPIESEVVTTPKPNRIRDSHDAKTGGIHGNTIQSNQR